MITFKKLALILLLCASFVWSECYNGEWVNEVLSLSVESGDYLITIDLVEKDYVHDGMFAIAFAEWRYIPFWQAFSHQGVIETKERFRMMRNRDINVDISCNHPCHIDYNICVDPLEKSDRTFRSLKDDDIPPLSDDMSSFVRLPDLRASEMYSGVLSQIRTDDGTQQEERARRLEGKAGGQSNSYSSDYLVESGQIWARRSEGTTETQSGVSVVFTILVMVGVAVMSLLLFTCIVRGIQEYRRDHPIKLSKARPFNGVAPSQSASTPQRIAEMAVDEAGEQKCKSKSFVESSHVDWNTTPGGAVSS